jgi:hypothetical protein
LPKNLVENILMEQEVAVMEVIIMTEDGKLLLEI